MTLVSRCGLTRATRRAAAVMALLTGLAPVIFKYTWGTQVSAAALPPKHVGIPPGI